ncbi:MAG: serine/threonine-protein kinase [Gammaproteobacteria bacterium]
MALIASPTAETCRSIGRYELGPLLGEGATGIVHRAYDPLMDRSVAIKSVKTQALTKAEIETAFAQFAHEARIAGKYMHRNIVAIYDVIEFAGSSHMVMEYVAGRGVDEYVKSLGPMRVQMALNIAYRCADALAYVHYHGVIHRDVKPGNIMYHHASDVVKLMDFSIAEEIDRPGARGAGTLAYMAPEHFDAARRITALTDIFALGATLYRMLTARFPWKREDTARQIVEVEPPSVALFRDDIPREVVWLVETAMAKDERDRFSSAARFARAIANVAAECYPDEPIGARDEPHLDL